MRVPLRWSWASPAAGSQLLLRRVDAELFRDFWLRSSGGPATYSLELYATQEDAQGATGLLASATHGPGAELVVPLVAEPGAAFSPLPASVFLYAVGSWGPSVLGWVAEPETLVVERVLALLQLYRAPHEALEAVRKLQRGHQVPEAGYPVVGVTTGLSFPDQSLGPPGWLGQSDLELVVWTLRANPEESWRLCNELSGALRSICLDEQRTWGGLVEQTEARGSLTLSSEQADNGWLYEGVLPLRLTLAQGTAQRRVDGHQSDGGKYAEAL